MNPAKIGASEKPRLTAQFWYPKARIRADEGTKSATDAARAGRYKYVKNPRMKVKMAIRTTERISPNVIIARGATNKLISNTGRRPNRSASSPPANCAENEPAPNKETVNAAWPTETPRWQVGSQDCEARADCFHKVFTFQQIEFMFYKTFAMIHDLCKTVKEIAL